MVSGKPIPQSMVASEIARLGDNVAATEAQLSRVRTPKRRAEITYQLRGQTDELSAFQVAAQDHRKAPMTLNTLKNTFPVAIFKETLSDGLEATRGPRESILTSENYAMLTPQLESTLKNRTASMALTSRQQIPEDAIPLHVAPSRYREMKSSGEWPESKVEPGQPFDRSLIFNSEMMTWHIIPTHPAFDRLVKNFGPQNIQAQGAWENEVVNNERNPAFMLFNSPGGYVPQKHRLYLDGISAEEAKTIGAAYDPGARPGRYMVDDRRPDVTDISKQYRTPEAAEREEALQAVQTERRTWYQKEAAAGALGVVAGGLATSVVQAEENSLDLTQVIDEMKNTSLASDTLGPEDIGNALAPGTRGPEDIGSNVSLDPATPAFDINSADPTGVDMTTSEAYLDAAGNEISRTAEQAGDHVSNAVATVTDTLKFAPDSLAAGNSLETVVQTAAPAVTELATAAGISAAGVKTAALLSAGAAKSLLPASAAIGVSVASGVAAALAGGYLAKKGIEAYRQRKQARGLLAKKAPWLMDTKTFHSTMGSRELGLSIERGVDDKGKHSVTLHMRDENGGSGKPVISVESDKRIPARTVSTLLHGALVDEAKNLGHEIPATVNEGLGTERNRIAIETTLRHDKGFNDITSYFTMADQRTSKIEEAVRREISVLTNPQLAASLVKTSTAIAGTMEKERKSAPHIRESLAPVGAKARRELGNGVRMLRDEGMRRVTHAIDAVKSTTRKPTRGQEIG